jgi:RNA polymerase sigma-70 factor (ECF subfamily)
VLDRLNPAERLAFVLHDTFAVSFEEIGAILGRSPAAARQLASRACRRVQGANLSSDAHRSQQRALVEAFLRALRAGDIEGLVAVLDPNVEVHIDKSASHTGAPTEIHGAREWARGAITFAHMAQAVEPALIDGAMGLILAPQGRLERALKLWFANGKIAQVEIIADPARLRDLEVAAP